MYNYNNQKQKLWASTDIFSVFPTEEERIEVYNEMAESNGWPTVDFENSKVFNTLNDFIVANWWNEKFEGANNLKNVVVTGYFGSWCGPRHIVPTKCQDIDTAIQKCCAINGDWEADVYFEEDENGVEHLFVGVSHHDGSCLYEISLLTNAEEVDEDDETEYKTCPISFAMIFEQ